MAALYLTLGLLNTRALNAHTESAPRGFAWERLRPIKAKVLRVIGWNHGIGRTEAGWTYSSGENDERGIPSAVFMLAADTRAKPGRTAAAVLAAAWKEFESRVEQAGPVTAEARAAFLIQRGMFVRHVEPEPESVHRLLAEVRVNRRTLTAYLIIFETPASTWESGWKVGEAILNSLALNNGV